MKTAIIGCGNVGCELARRLADRNHGVVAVRRSQAALDSIATIGENVETVAADVTEPESLQALPDVDVLVYAVSAGGRGADAASRAYVGGLENVIEEFGSRTDPPDRLIYTSSTGVYGDHDGAWVDESTPIEPSTEKTRVLARAEKLVHERARANGIAGTVVRFGGLYGPDRYRLHRYIDGPVTAGVLNMIHRDDAAGVLEFLLSTGTARNETVLAVDHEPVEKHHFADWLADRCSVPHPPKQSVEDRLDDEAVSSATAARLRATKRCSNETLLELGYEFAYPTFRSGYQSAIESFEQSQ